MRLDPDGCTFWYTTEYYMLTASFDWSTQIASARFAGCQNPAYDGYIELCKQTDPDYPVSGTFDFTLTAPFFSTGPIGVPVGSCSPPIQVPSGIVTVNEAQQIGVAVENVTAYSYDQYGNYIDELDSWTPPQQTATVTVVPGDVNLETVATFTNYAAPPGTLKICKIAGSPSLVGMPFTFTSTYGTTQHMDIVTAGPPPGGNCVIDGTWPVNTPVTVAENVPSGVVVSKITVEPPDRGGPPNLNGGYVTVKIGSGFTEVDFTDVVATIPPGSCLPSEALSVLFVNGTNVVAYVPLANWGNGGTTGVAVVDIEGHYLNGSGPHVAATGNDYINSCASEPTLAETVCVSSQHQNESNGVYIIKGNDPFTVTPLHSGASGTIQFSGSPCENCGIAMDGVNHRAVLGLSDATKPAFQFLDLLTNTFGPLIDPPAGQISEDFLIDPKNNLLLSPGEGLTTGTVQSCNPVPPGGCHPNYEIADIRPILSTPIFYENRLDTQTGFPTSGAPDSAAEDCSSAVALASIESGNQSLVSTPFVADLTKATYTIGSPVNTWTDPFPNSQFFPLSGSKLGVGGPAPGPIAVAQGGSHIGILAQETGCNPTCPTGIHTDTITAFRLNLPPYTAVNPPFADWVTCNMGPNAAHPFLQGFDPHTVTAYQSPGTFYTPNDPIAVLANRTPWPPAGSPDTLAVVDLKLMLDPTVVPRVYVNGIDQHICVGGVPTGTPGILPQNTTPIPLVRFIPNIH